MQEAEAKSRKNRKPGPGVDRLATAARLGALEKQLGVAVKRHRDPGAVTNTNPFAKEGEGKRVEKDETIVIEKGF
jgi:hypothetical protein